LNDLFDLMLPANEVDTVGGLVTAVLGVLPKVGDVANIHTICLRVEEMDFNRVGRVSMALDEQQRRIWQEAQS
jgi:Mg2+/Co2+ transporter CorC